MTPPTALSRLIEEAEITVGHLCGEHPNNTYALVRAIEEAKSALVRGEK